MAALYFLPGRKLRRTIAPLILAAAVPLGGCFDDDDPPVATTISVASGAPERVTGGTALVDVAVPPGIDPSVIRLFANDRDVTASLKPTADGSKLRGLVANLSNGSNKLVVRGTENQVSGELAIINHPITGPVFSGKQLTPFECRTVESGLGAPTDVNCSAAPRQDWYYFSATGVRNLLAAPLGPRPADLGTTTTLEGRTLPFIVRVESLTINRSVVRIAVLDDPKAANAWNPAGWNGRVVLRFGESTAAQYNQGSNNATDVFKNDAIDTQALTALGHGFIYVVSSLNIHKVNVNDVVAAETAMMIREYIAKNYGPPRWMVGMGGSGGAIQQMLIAQNYPGILDGIMPDAAFPDVFGTALAVSDCRLLNRLFAANPASDTVRKAFEGHAKNTCATWDASNGDVILATSGAINPACGLNDQSKVYHPVNNPTGARCTVYDIHANTLGKDAATAAARRPLDNVGVQYGLEALKKGTITTSQFLDVNEKIGGFDGDGNIAAKRTVADADALKLSYEMGRIGSGSGGLATVPILHMRAYAEPAGDIHTIYNDIKIREQLKKANGHADNQVIWLFPNPALAPLLGLPASQQLALAKVLKEGFVARLTLMTSWLDAITADPAPLSPAKVARLKPADAVDSCWNVTNAERVRETATFSEAGTCNTLYPKTPTPRMAAGGPIADDIVKCQLKPIADADYAPVAFTAAEKLRLAAIFPSGVCDFSKPGVGQTTVKGTWLSY